MIKLTKFIEESRSELQKVTWPTREEAIKLTQTVIIMSIIFSAYLGFLDYGFTQLLNWVITIK